MITSKVNKLVGLKEDVFLELLRSNKIQHKRARLIPLLKTGDEMALTSIFLSSLRLIKEFRNSVFKDIKMSRSGKFHYLTEVNIPELSKHRIDGLVVCIKSGKVADAAIFEMKKENNALDKKQVTDYINLGLKLKIPKLVTVSNQFVSSPEQFPIDIKHSKRINLYHFSWTSLLTKGRILLFNNETNIADEDQIEIMKEVLYYFESEKSGVKIYTKMSDEWKTLTENIAAHKAIKEKSPVLEKAILSWYEEEKDMALKLGRELGANVKSKNRTKDSLKADKKYVIKHKAIQTSIAVKNSVSDINIKADFEKKNLYMSVNMNPPETGTNNAKVNWLIRHLENGKKKNETAFFKNAKKVYISANIKYSRIPITFALAEISKLKEIHKKDEIKNFKIYIVKELGRSFTSTKGFVTNIEDLLLDFYEGYVQHLVNWTKPAPKIDRTEEEVLSISRKDAIIPPI